MRWLIVGAGALGGYFGGRLLQAGEDVTFLVRPRRMAQLGTTGLVIKSPLGDAHIPSPPCVLAQDLAAPYDMVVVGCKAYDLTDAMASFAPAVGPDTGILPLLNGMRHLDQLSARFGASRVLGGLCIISAALDADGAVQHYNNLHTLTYGELDGSRSDRMRAMEAAFEPANVTARASNVILQEMWEKWVLISAAAGATCLMRAAICDILEVGAIDLIIGILDDCAAIAAANGFAPRPEARERMVAFLTAPGSTMTASMMKDMERHARIEGEHIIGDLISRVGPGTSAPVLLRTVHAHLRAYEARRAREAATPPT
ncbi:MAG TPA: 2-dehydropantoate 2-reductase [Burkholderiaceae bacterium]|nr:2-dehydropantoate 2-reductase [Burkholderiaceae bacterium]